jgi:hypothetical protein
LAIYFEFKKTKKVGINHERKEGIVTKAICNRIMIVQQKIHTYSDKNYFDLVLEDKGTKQKFRYHTEITPSKQGFVDFIENNFRQFRSEARVCAEYETINDKNIISRFAIGQ